MDNRHNSFLDHFAAVVLVANLGETINWYLEKLSFKVELTWGEPTTYVILKRDNLVLHFTQVDKNYELEKIHPTIYVFVKNVEKLYEEFNSKSEIKMGELVKADYSMTDFDLYDLNGFRITFGEGKGNTQ